MKVLNIILKIVAVLAVIAGIVYVIITYGEKIVAWTKNLWFTCKEKFEGWFCKSSDEEVDALIVDEADFATE